MTTRHDHVVALLVAFAVLALVAHLVASLRGWDPAYGAPSPSTVGVAGDVGPVGEVLAAAPDRPASFTLAELAAGEVSRERFDAYWQDVVARVESTPCPLPAAAPGSTVVTFTLGITPPADLLAAGWTDWAPELAAARAAHAARCAAVR